MAYLLALSLSRLVIFQDQKPETNDIVVALPDIYFQTNVFSAEVDVNLNPPATNSRRYFYQDIDDTGEPFGKPREVSQAEFYPQITRMLGRGVLDRSSLDALFLNERYKSFLKTLLDADIVAKKELAKVGRVYIHFEWTESAYVLDEVVPGIIAKEDWLALLKNRNNTYFELLARVKVANFSRNGLDETRKWLDNQVSRLMAESEYGFVADLAKSYAEVVKKGASFPPESQRGLFSAFDVSAKANSLLYARNLKRFYILLNLPLPSEEIICSVLKERVNKDFQKGEVDVGTSIIFLDLGLKFPKEFAVIYRDYLLKDLGELEEIEYFIQLAGEDAKPELWKWYAKRAYAMHFDKEQRKAYGDQRDYYHMAVGGYRRVFDFAKNNRESAVKNDDKEMLALLRWLKLDEHTMNELLGEINDPSARMRDILIVYEMADKDPRFYLYLEKLDERVRIFEKSSAIPFRDAAELAVYLKDIKRTNEVSSRIVDYALHRLKEGDDDSSLSVFTELEAIYDLFKQLDFTDGALSLAYRLCDAGFVLPARKFFHLGGIGAEAEAQFYGKHDDNYWEKLHEDYNLLRRASPSP